LYDRRVIEALDVGEVADVKSCDMVVRCQGEICESSVLGDVGATGRKVGEEDSEREIKGTY
jgi:hypothetical protein